MSPYIPQPERNLLDPSIDILCGQMDTPGQLTYVICRLLWDMWQRNRNFSWWATLRGAVEEAVSDFRDRHITILDQYNYESDKRRENGEVYYEDILRS